MTLDKTIQEADREFRAQCVALKCVPWNINPLANSPYLTGVSTNWSDPTFQLELQQIANAAITIARKHKLTPAYEYPIVAAGGVVAVYVGWEKP